MIAIGGCGGIKAADLFVVERSGSVPGAGLTLLVDEEGNVRCNGGEELKLSDPQIIQARALQEELKEPAEAGMSLPAKAGSVLSYRVRDENGLVSFADDSGGQPKVLRNLALFVLQVAQGVCRLPQGGA
jgi:predicted metal-dependent peptidase